ncbi:hypothetical protein B0H14DRAFT_2564331 [Mycena olivaceomarginata]|nr:hypothetical protein B0H14DRAFT_2564331 [Mycena olivaceomarginata]
MHPDLALQDAAADKVSQRFHSFPFFMLPPPVAPPPRVHFDVNIHTHTHTHVYDIPPGMTASTHVPTPDNPSTPPTELESLTALVDRLSIASIEAMRLAIEVKARLPAVVAAEASARANAPAAFDPLWVRGVPRTPDDLDAAHPEGSGEVCAEADRLCDRVPRGFKQLKCSRREALAWYREQYYLPDGDGVQKWVEA